MKQVSIKKNFAYSLAYQILILVTPFITTPYISRVLGADGVGIYSYTNSIIAYFTLFAALGTVSYGTREIAQHRDDKAQLSKLFWEIEIMTIISSLVCLAAWILFICVSKEYRIYYIALTPLILGTHFDISWFYSGCEQMKYNVIRNSAVKIIGIIALFVFIRTKDDLIWYVVINSLVQMLGNLTMWTYLPKFLEKIDFRTITLKHHFKETLVYFVPTIATSIYTVLDKTLIGVITKDEYQNGYYEQATKIVNIIKSLVFTSVNSVMGARISYLFASDKIDEIKEKISLSLDYIMFLGFGCVFGISAVANVFIPIFCGKGYEPVVNLLYVLSPIVLIIGISNSLGSLYYTPSGQRAKSAKIIVLGSVVNLILNLIFIPKLGGTGAVISSLIAETLISVLYLRFSHGFMTVGMILQKSWKRLIAGAIMLIAVMLINTNIHIMPILQLILEIAAGVLIYIGLLAMMKDSMIKWGLEFIRGKVKK